jgi:hypothetical protein
VNPLAFVGLHSSLEARAHFPRQTWARAFHRGTMKQALAPISRERYYNALPICDCARDPDGPIFEACRAVLRAKACCEGEASSEGGLLQVGGRHRAETPTMPLMRLGRTDGRIYCKLIEQTVVGRNMDHERVSPLLQ